MATSAISYLPATVTTTPEIFKDIPASSQADFALWEKEWKAIDPSSGTSASTSSAGSSLNSGLISALLPILSALISWMSQAMSSNGGGGSDSDGDSDNSGGTGVQPLNYSAGNNGGSHGPIAPGGNPADIAEKLQGRSADSIVANQDVKMDHGISNHVDCANFASAVLVKSGEIPASQHTNSVATLKSELLNKDGWHEVGKSHAKRGDVCIVGGDEHVEIVDHVDKNGNIVLIGSNNVLSDGSQAVCTDSGTCNHKSVEILSA
ncbi:MAG: hypothetical protein KGQ57_07650 [Burkholderiales bacterium]|nr:hypothetical protein [Burkholderiales bacterium]